MSKLEHNIKNAFEAQDAKNKLQNKAEMWSRLDASMPSSKGVAMWWRVAAILLGVVLFSGAIAALSMRSKQQNRLEKMELERQELVATIDSLVRIPTKTQTETQVVEKEKIVFRDRIVYKETPDTKTENWEKKYVDLSDSATVLAAKQNNYRREIAELTEQLNRSDAELEEYKRESNANNTTVENSASPFELRSERIQLDIEKKPAAKNPEMEMKVFQKQFIENRNNLNKNIFKK